MRINHNIAAMNTYRQLTANTGATSKSLEKLSSGLKINRLVMMPQDWQFLRKCVARSVVWTQLPKMHLMVFL